MDTRLLTRGPGGICTRAPCASIPDVILFSLEDCTTKTFNYAAQTSYKVGDQVKVVNNKLTRQ